MNPALSACQFGPLGCDPQGGETVCCDVCGKRACDFHGDYPGAQAYAGGDWRCPDCMPMHDDPEFGFGGPAGVLSDRDADPGAYS